MASRKPKKSQKLGSSRRYKNRNRDIEEKENEDGFPDPGNEEHDSEQSQFHTVSENQASNESSVLHSDQPVIACTNPNTSVVELSPHPQSEDLLGQAEVTSKKRKMGSTRKSNRNFKFEGIYEDEPEHRVQLSEGLRDEQEVTVEAFIKGKEDLSLSDCAPSQTSEQEISLLKGNHLAFGAIMRNDDNGKKDEQQHLEAALQSKPMDMSSSEFNQKSRTDTTFTPYTVVKTMDDQSSLNLNNIDKQEHKQEREDVDTLEGCTAEDRGQDEVTGVRSVSLVNEHEHGTQDDTVEDTVDHCLEHKDATLDLKESIYKSKSTEFREDGDEYKEVSVVGDRRDNDSDEGVAATNLNYAMEPYRYINSPLKLKNQDTGASPDQFLSYEFTFQCDSEIKCYREEQYDLSEARFWTGADKDIGKKEADMYYDEEEKYRAIGTEREVGNEDMQSTTSNQFSKLSSTNMLDFVTESELIPAETQHGKTETISQTHNPQHNNPGEFPTELEIQSKEGVCSDQTDRSEILHTETGVIEEDNKDIKKEINAGSTESFTKVDFIRVDDEKDGTSTFMNKLEILSVITNVQDAVTDQTSIVVQEPGIESIVHAYNISDSVELIPETQVKLDMQVYNAIAVPDQKDSFKAMKETIWVQSTKESAQISEDGTLSFTPETYSPQSSESLNIMEPEEERTDENMLKAEVINGNINTSQENNETPQHISTEVVNTNQECSVLDRQDGETVMVKNIYGGVDTTHVVLSDVLQHLPDNGDLKMQSRAEVAESIARNEQAIWEGDSQHISLEYSQQNTFPDLEIGQSKSMDCTEFATFTINTDHLLTSVEPMNAAEVAQLAEAKMIEVATTPIQEEAHMLISINRRKMESIRNTQEAKIEEKDKEKDMTGEEKDLAYADKYMLFDAENGVSEKNTMEDLAKCSQQNMHSNLSSQTLSFSQTTIKHPSPTKEHPDFNKDKGKSIENVENRNAEIHTQSQTKKKKKLGSTRKPHGRHQAHNEGGEGEWKDPENTEEIEYQIVTQAATSNLLTELQKTMSEVTRDIHDSPVTTEQKQIIISEVEMETGEIDGPHPILSAEVDQIHTVVSDEQSNTEALTDITEPNERVNEEKDAESTLLNEQEMAPIIMKIQDDAFTEHVLFTVKKHGNENPDQECDSEVNAHSTTCSPEELIPETQVMSDIQLNTQNIHAVGPDQNQNIFEEHLQSPNKKESEPEQLESTSPFVQIHESKSCQIDVIKENLEFRSSEKRRKIGSTRKSLRGQICGSDQKNKIEEMKEKEMIQEQNMDQICTNTGAIEDKNNDTNEEINAGPTKNVIDKEIRTVCSQQYMVCELSSQNTDLLLTTTEHPSPATEHSDFKEDDENHIENVENRNAEIHTQSQTKKKKKFGSTRKPHGRHQAHNEGEEGEWNDPENTEEIEHQIVTQAATSNLLTELQKTMSEMTLDIHDSPVTTEQKQIIQSEVEMETGEIDGPHPILSAEVDQIHTVVSDEQSNAEALTDITEPNERVDEEKNAESTLLNEQEMAPIITTIQDDAFIEHVPLTVKKHGNESPDNDGVSEVNAHSTTCGPEQLSISEVTLDIHDSPVKTEQKQIIQSVVEMGTGEIDASPAILSAEVDQIHAVVFDEQSNAAGLTDITEPNERVNEEKDVQSTLLNEQEMAPIITTIQDDAFIEHVPLTVKMPGNESPDNECASEVKAHSTTCGPEELIPEIQVMSDMQMNTQNIHTEIHMQSQTKKKKKLGSTRKSHGRHQAHNEGEEGEWNDPENTEEIEHQIVTQAATSNLLTEPQKTMSEVTLDIHDSPVTTEQKQIIQSVVEMGTGDIDASPAILSAEVDQIHAVVFDEQSNAAGLTNITEPNERVHEEKNAESTLLNEQEMAPIIMKIQDDAFIDHVPFTVKKPGNKSSDNECASEVKAHSTTCGPKELIPEAQVMSDMQMNTQNIHTEIHMQSQTKKKKKFGSTRKPLGRYQALAEGEEGERKDVDNTEEIQIIDQAASSNLLTEQQNVELLHDSLKPSLRSEQSVYHPVELFPERQARLDMPVVSEQYHMMSEGHQDNPKNRESEPEQCESTCPVVHIQELKLALDDIATQNSGESNSGRRKKMDSTRRSLRVIKEKENTQEQTTEESTPISEKDHSLNFTELSHQSIQTHSKPLNIIEPEVDKLDSAGKNLEEEQSKQEAWQKTNDMDPRYAGHSDREYLKLAVTEDMLNPDSIFCDTETRVQEYEPQIHNKLDQSEDSLLSEIEFYLNKSFESTLNTTVLNSNISELSEPMSEASLQLSSSQNPQIHMETISPARKRKMGSSRKLSRNKHAENISNESRGPEQEKENLDKNNPKKSEAKRDAKTVKETVMAEGTEVMKESVEFTSEVQALSQINESRTQDTGKPLPEGRRKFGSRRTAEGISGLGAFTHDDYESNEKKTDVIMDDLRVSDPNFISEPESTPISHPVSEPRPGTEEVAKDTNASTEAVHVSLDNIQKTSPCIVRTGGRQKIDFEQWNEQIPDFGLAVYNIVMVGNSNVGKTSFIKHLQSGRFIPDYSATIGVDTFVQTVTFGNRTVKLYVWDTAGQERYHSITRQVFHKAQGLLLMYDITSLQSFHAVRAWISQVQEKAPPDVILMLLGNKNDCAHREVQLQEGEALAKEYNIHFMECSAATGENLSESLKTLAWLLVKQRVRKEEEHTTLQPKPQNKKSGCC